MLSSSNCGGDGDQAKSPSESVSRLTYRALVREEVLALISSPEFLSELATKLLEWQTKVKDEPIPEYVKSYDLCEISKSLIIPKELKESLTILECKNKEFAEVMTLTDKLFGELKDNIEELSLEMENMIKRGKLVKLPSDIPTSQDDENQATFTCLNEEESNCASKKWQLYNNQLNKFQQNLLDTSLSNSPSQLIISETVTKLLPYCSDPIIPLNVPCVWDVASSFNSLTETLCGESE